VERALLVLALTLGLFASPVIYVWARDGSPWYLVYLLWLAVIMLGGWVGRGSRGHDI
jgi:hypothetical protein